MTKKKVQEYFGPPCCSFVPQTVATNSTLCFGCEGLRNIKQHELLCVCVISLKQLLCVCVISLKQLLCVCVISEAITLCVCDLSETIWYMHAYTVIGGVPNKNIFYWLFVIFMV